MNPKPTPSNNQAEKIKMGVSIAVIAVSLSYTAIRIKNQLYPSMSPTVAAAPAPSPVTPPPAGSPSVTTVAASGPSAAPDTTSQEILPQGPVRMASRDPFAVTPKYRKMIPVKGPGKIVFTSSLKRPKGLGSGFSTTIKSGQYRGLSASIGGLPPAGVNLDSLKPEKLPSYAANSREIPSAIPSDAKADAGTKKSVSDEAGVKERSEESYVLTGTVDGDTPMAILRGSQKNYLVHEGDWLEGYQVRRVQARQVILRDRSGRRKVLNLGGARPNAI